MSSTSTIDGTMPLLNLNHTLPVHETPADWTPDRRFIDVKISDEMRSAVDETHDPRPTVSEALKVAVAQLNKMK
jgi:hypothetical protein